MTQAYRDELEHITALLANPIDWYDMIAISSLLASLDYTPGSYSKPQVGQLSLFDTVEWNEGR